MSDDRTAAHPADRADARPVESAAAPPDSAQPPLVVEDLLVEDVSIDGMCGVY